MSATVLQLTNYKEILLIPSRYMYVFRDVFFVQYYGTDKRS